MRIVFMGTPDFSVNTLQCLIDSEHQVVGVVTQPDKPKGRGGKMQPTPVKELAMEAGIEVYQPERIKGSDFIEVLRELKPDVIVVVAFGQILPKDVLDLPKYGCINVHASLLPKLRGAAPIQWSVIQGDKISGVTIQQMNEGIDTGDILLVKEYELDPKETGGSLFDKLAEFGGPLTLEVLKMAEEGRLTPVPQDHDAHTYAKMLSKETGRIDFTKSAQEIERLIRGLNPWPSAFTFFQGKMMKIWDADVVPEEEIQKNEVSEGEPGSIIFVSKKAMWVQTGQGVLGINELQLAGKKRMPTDAFLRGFSIEQGAMFTSE